MELRVLQYFLGVAREQSIVRAAESLHLSQPTLSTQLRALEEELGVQLLIRGTKGSRKVTLTEEGMILRKRAEEIMALVQKARREVALSDQVIVGDICLAAGETDAVRFLARTAQALYREHPGIHYRMTSGNARFVYEQLDRGLADFGVVFDTVDPVKYNVFPLPFRDTWGVLMRRDAPLAAKEAIAPEDLWPLPLIVSEQEKERGTLSAWMRREEEALEIVATYNLLFNASLMVEEGLGYAIGLDGIIHTGADSRLCFRPLTPKREQSMSLIWKKYQILSKASEKFLMKLRSVME